MEPKVVSIGTEDGELNFELVDTEVSVANSIRRVALTQINSLVFRGFPHKENLINIIKNTSKFNNEYLKHRIQNIPVFYSNESNFEAFINQYEVRLNVSNDTNNTLYVTTEHFNIYDKKTGAPVNSSGQIRVKQIFPPDQITGHYIVIAVLSPKITEDDIIEELNMTMDFSIGCAKEDSCWNMVTKCCYENKRDTTRLDKFLKKDPETVREYYKNDAVAIDTYMKGTMNEYDTTDFKLLDGQRFYIKNHYIMKIESIGVFTNEYIVKKSCDYIISKLIEFNNYTATNRASIESVKISTGTDYAIFMDKSNTSIIYNLFVPNDDYTIGKIIETYLFNMFNKDIYYVSFKKEHPHDKHCYIMFSYIEEDITLEQIISNLRSVSEELIKVYQSISSKF
jgi:DNA-directed RNA polymerase subunit L